MDNNKRYFHSVTGYFVVEDQVLSTTEGLVDERYTNELFDMATPRLITEIRKSMDRCKDADIMLKLKIIIVLFCNTVEEVQFPTIQLSDLLKEIREKYYNMLLLKWDDKIRDILSEDNYTPLEVDSEEYYRQLMQVFPYENDLLNSSGSSGSKPAGESAAASGFHKRFSFSLCVPKIFAAMREFVKNCKKFAEGLNSSQTELDDMIRKPTNRLITDKLSENIRLVINQASLIQLVQVVVNTIYLEKSIEMLEQYLLEVIG